MTIKQFSRRSVLKAGAAVTAASAFGSFATPSFAAGELMPTSARRVVVIGGGWGGATAAKYLRMHDSSIEVVLVEENPIFYSCPVSNWVIGHLKTMKDITVSYDGLANNRGVKVVQDRVTAIDPAAKTVTVSDGFIRYDRLIVAPGITLKYETIEGLNEAGRAAFPAAWKAGAETKLLRDQLAAMPDGGTVVQSVPRGPYRCPPGPYERACLIANYLKTNKPGSKLIVLDANSKIVSKGKLFQAAWDAHYSDIIDYRPDHEVVKVDPSTSTISTDFDDFKADVGNIVPTQRANDLCRTADLLASDREWVPVNPYTYESTRHSDVHVVGDSTDQTTVGKVPKSGFVANSMGKVAAGAISALLNDKEPPRPLMANTCYSLVGPDEGISVTAVYDWNDEDSKMVSIKGAGGLSPEPTNLIAGNADDWAKAIWSDMLG